MGHASTCRVHRIHGLPITSYTKSVHVQICILENMISLYGYDLDFSYQWSENNCIVHITGYDSQNTLISTIYTFQRTRPIASQRVEFQNLTQTMFQETRHKFW